MLYHVLNARTLPFLFFTALLGCTTPSQKETTTLFSLLSSSQTGVRFSNNLSYTEELNPYTYRNFFNGGGGGIGDFKNDRLQEVGRGHG